MNFMTSRLTRISFLKFTLIVFLSVVLFDIALFLKFYFNSAPSYTKDPVLNFYPEMLPIDTKLFDNRDLPPEFSDQKPLHSQFCTQGQMFTPLHQKWAKEFHESPAYHNKQWQFAYILQAISQHGLLESGKKGLGFGVGVEPLPAVFAKHGVSVLATDLDFERAKQLGWVDSNQYLISLASLNTRNIAPPSQFRKLVKIRRVDMNHIPTDLKNFDFIWSTCSLGHLGNIEKGLAFIEKSLSTLKHGGIAVHTTEVNLSSNAETLDNGGTVLFRYQDIVKLIKALEAQGHQVKVNLNIGSDELDRYVDQPPYNRNKHIKLRVDRYAVAAFGLIIQKN